MTPIDVLMIEDNPGDIVLMKEALKRTDLSYRITIVRNGMDAMEYLLKQGDFTTADSPELIILDLKLPRKTGMEVLDEIQQNPALSIIPLVILSSSQSELDRARKYRLPDRSFQLKPSTFQGYIALVELIESFRRESAGRGAPGQ